MVTSDLTGKATTTDPVEVTTDPNTKVELLDKDGNVIGSVQLIIRVMSITPTKPIPEGNVTAKATIMQNIQIVLHLNRKSDDTTAAWLLAI